MSDVWSVQISGLINLPVSVGDLKGLRPSGWALTQLVLMKFCRLENYSCQKNAHVKSWAFGSLTHFFLSLSLLLLFQHSYIAHISPQLSPQLTRHLFSLSLSFTRCIENERQVFSSLGNCYYITDTVQPEACRAAARNTVPAAITALKTHTFR